MNDINKELDLLSIVVDHIDEIKTLSDILHRKIAHLPASEQLDYTLRIRSIITEMLIDLDYKKHPFGTSDPV